MVRKAGATSCQMALGLQCRASGKVPRTTGSGPESILHEAGGWQ